MTDLSLQLHCRGVADCISCAWCLNSKKAFSNGPGVSLTTVMGFECSDAIKHECVWNDRVCRDASLLEHRSVIKPSYNHPVLACTQLHISWSILRVIQIPHSLVYIYTYVLHITLLIVVCQIGAISKVSCSQCMSSGAHSTGPGALTSAQVMYSGSDSGNLRGFQNQESNASRAQKRETAENPALPHFMYMFLPLQMLWTEGWLNRPGFIYCSSPSHEQHWCAKTLQHAIIYYKTPKVWIGNPSMQPGSCMKHHILYVFVACCCAESQPNTAVN